MPLCPSLGTPVARAEVDTAVAGSLVPCGEAMEQEGQKSPAFRLKERTGDGEVKATHSCDSHTDALRSLGLGVKTTTRSTDSNTVTILL